MIDLNDILDALWDNRTLLLGALIFMSPKIPLVRGYMGRAWRDFTGAEAIREDLEKYRMAQAEWQVGLGKRLDHIDASVDDHVRDDTRHMVGPK